MRFAAGIQTLVESGCDIFLEIGPSPVLLAMGRQCATKSNALWLPTLRPGRDDWSESLTSLQALHHAGVRVDWKGFDGDYPRRRIRLPTYPFQRERFWFESRRDPADELQAHRILSRPAAHPLLGAPLRSPALKDAVFQSQLSAGQPSFLADHQICGHVILPASAYVEMALAGAHHLFGDGPHSVKNLRMQEALRLDLDTPTSVQMVFEAKDEGSAAFEMYSAPGDGQDADALWTRHVIGLVAKAAEFETDENKTADLQAILTRCAESVDTTALYQKLYEQGSEFGPAFRNLHSLWRGTTETLAQIILAESLHSEAARYRFHPALLDACFQAAAQALPGGAHPTAEDEVLLPVNIERVQVLRDIPATLWSHGRLRGTPVPGSSIFTLDLEIYDSEGHALGGIAGLQLKRVKRITLNQAPRAAEKDWLFEIQWRETPQR